MLLWRVIIYMPERYTIIPRTLCFVFNTKGQVLFIKYSERKGAMSGYFNPPGGHIERGEDIIENANREIREETGIVARDTRLAGVVHVTNFFGKNILMFVTVSSADQQPLAASEEGEPLWISKENLAGLKIFEDVGLIVERLGREGDQVFTAVSSFRDDGSIEFITFSN